jgi:zinc protease
MNPTRIRSTLMIVMLVIAPSLAQATPHMTAPDPTVVRAKLDNGLEVIVVKNPLAPVVTTMLNYRVGSNEAPKGFPGTAHALEHMMFRGSPGITEHQLAVINASLGGDSNADTQQMVTQYFFTVPAKDLDVVLRIEASRMQSITGGSKGWKDERGAIEQEVAMDMSNPEYVMYSKLLKAMFKGTPYAHDALGTRPSFDKTTWAMLKRFHDTWYAPNNAVLIIVGDVDPARTIAMVKKRFSAIPARKLPSRPAIRLQPVKPETLRLTTDRPYGFAVIAFRMPGWNSPDYAAAEILADVMDSQRGRLFGLVPEGKALFTDFSVETLPESGLGYAVAGFPKGGDAKALLKSVRQVLSDIRHDVPADLIEAAKRHEIAGLEFSKNSVQGLADLWSQAVVEGRHSPADDINAIRAVTVKDVARVAQTYLDQAHAITAILTPNTSGKPIASKGFGGKESFSKPPKHGVKLPAWAEKAVNRLEVPALTVKPTVFQMANGLKLIVQPEAISKTVSIYGQIRSRPVMETAKGKEGVDEVLDQLFSFGTTSLDRLAFQKALDDISADESAGTDFGVQVPVAHLERGVQLLADNELKPALPKHAFEIIKRQVASEVAGRLHSPGYLATRSMLAGVYPKDDPTLRQATPESVSALGMGDVKAYYHKVFRPDLTTIVVIGDVQPKQAHQLIAKYFGAWKAEGPKPETLLPPVGPNKASATTVPDSSRVQDKVTAAETVGVHLSDPDYDTLVLGNHVFGGDSFATRLYRALRVNSGLVYYVFTGFQVSQSRGLFMVEYACDPPNVSKVHAIIVRELQTMRTSPVSAEELRRAKALLLRRIPLGEGSEERIAKGLLYRATHDLPLDQPMISAHRYMKLTAAQVKAAYAKYIRPDDLVQVVQGPAPH